MPKPTLDEVLRDLDQRGELNYVSICADANGFTAAFTPASNYTVLRASHADPAEAIRLAVAQAKLARPRKGDKKPAPDADDIDFG